MSSLSGAGLGDCSTVGSCSDGRCRNRAGKGGAEIMNVVKCCLLAECTRGCRLQVTIRVSRWALDILIVGAAEILVCL